VQTPLGGELEPVIGHEHVGLDAPSVFVAASCHVHGHYVIGISGQPEPLEGLLSVLFYASSIEQHLAVVSLGLRNTMFGGSRHPSSSFVGGATQQLAKLLGRGSIEDPYGYFVHVESFRAGGHQKAYLIRKAQVKDGTASRGNVCVVGAVGFVVVGLVGQVQHVKLCAQVLAEAIGSHGVKAPVRRNFQLVCRV